MCFHGFYLCTRNLKGIQILAKWKSELLPAAIWSSANNVWFFSPPKMNHVDVLGPLTLSLELWYTPLIGSACLRKHSPLAYRVWDALQRKCVDGRRSAELDKSAEDRNHLSTYLPHDWTPGESANAIHPAEMGLLSEGAAVSAAMDLLLFVSNASFHSSVGWEWFHQAQLYKECYLFLYFTCWFALDYSWDMNGTSDLLCSRSGVDIR